MENNSGGLHMGNDSRGLQWRITVVDGELQMENNSGGLQT